VTAYLLRYTKRSVISSCIFDGFGLQIIPELEEIMRPNKFVCLRELAGKHIKIKDVDGFQWQMDKDTVSSAFWGEGVGDPMRINSVYY